MHNDLCCRTRQLIAAFVYTSFYHETYAELICLFIQAQALVLSVSLICSCINYRISLNCFGFSLLKLMLAISFSFSDCRVHLCSTVNW